MREGRSLEHEETWEAHLQEVVGSLIQASGIAPGATGIEFSVRSGWVDLEVRTHPLTLYTTQHHATQRGYSETEWELGADVSVIGTGLGEDTLVAKTYWAPGMSRRESQNYRTLRRRGVGARRAEELAKALTSEEVPESVLGSVVEAVAAARKKVGKSGKVYVSAGEDVAPGRSIEDLRSAVVGTAVVRSGWAGPDHYGVIYDEEGGGCETELSAWWAPGLTVSELEVYTALRGDGAGASEALGAVRALGVRP